jgi:hypothetical protein
LAELRIALAKTYDRRRGKEKLFQREEDFIVFIRSCRGYTSYLKGISGYFRAKLQRDQWMGSNEGARKDSVLCVHPLLSICVPQITMGGGD